MMTSRVLRLLLLTAAVCFALLLANVCGVATDNSDVSYDVIIGARCRARCLSQLQVNVAKDVQLITLSS